MKQFYLNHQLINLFFIYLQKHWPRKTPANDNTQEQQSNFHHIKEIIATATPGAANKSTGLPEHI